MVCSSCNNEAEVEKEGRKEMVCSSCNRGRSREGRKEMVCSSCNNEAEVEKEGRKWFVVVVIMRQK